MLFTNALLFTALAGLGVPVLIHLLLKRRNERLKFSTLRFFEPQQTQARSRRRLRNLLLLALRLLIFALIVLAFTRPFLPQSATNESTPRRQVVVVLDRSLSLLARDTAGRRWDNAQQALREVLGKLRDGDRAALVACAGSAEMVSGFAAAPAVLARAAALEPARTSGQLADGLREAMRLISEADPAWKSSVVVISDFQRLSAQGLDDVPVPASLEVRAITVGDVMTPNVAVTDLLLAPGDTNRPQATLLSHSDEVATVQAEFLLDGQPQWTRSVALAAGATTNLDLTLPRLDAGRHEAQLRLTGADGLAIDDARWAVLRVRAPLRIGLVEGRRNVRSFAGQSFFLNLALDPFGGTNTAANGRFAVERFGPLDLPTKLRRRAGNSPSFDAVLVPAQSALGAEGATALQEYVRGGGGVMLFGGDEWTAGRLNALLAGIAPAQLLAVESAEAIAPWTIGETDPGAASFAPFRRPGSGTLSLTAFRRRQAVEPTGGATILARFDDGVPLLLARTVGAGRVLLANTSADTAWTDWPKHKTFVPWIQASTLWLTGRSAEASAREREPEFLCDAPAEWSLGPGGAGQNFTLRPPTGPERNLTASAAGILDLPFNAPGVWRLLDDAGNEVRAFAVNPTTAESDLAAVTPAEFERRLARRDEGPGGGPGLVGTDPGRREFWRPLLFAALLLLFVETVIANRTNA
jgi:hypothetical protein